MPISARAPITSSSEGVISMATFVSAARSSPITIMRGAPKRSTSRPPGMLQSVCEATSAAVITPTAGRPTP